MAANDSTAARPTEHIRHAKHAEHAEDPVLTYQTDARQGSDSPNAHPNDAAREQEQERECRSTVKVELYAN
jgi:hypothetical protein